MISRLQPGSPIGDVIRPYLPALPAVVLLGLLAAALEGLGIGLMIPLLDLIAGREAGTGAGALPTALTGFAGSLEPVGRLIAISLAILALIVLKNLVSLGAALLNAWLYGKAGHALRNALTERLTAVGQPFFAQAAPGRLLNIISNESWRASDALATVLGAVVHASAALILFLFLCLLSWRLTLVVLASVVVIYLVQATVAAQLRRLSREVAQHNGRLASRMLHLVEGARLIRAFGQETEERRRFDRASDVVRGLVLRLEARRSVISPVVEVLHALLFLGVIVGAWRAGVEFSVIGAFVVLLYRMQPHVRGVQNAGATLQSLSGSLDEVEWLLDPRGKPQPPCGRTQAQGLRDAIRFEDVGFTYPQAGSSPVLNGATFEIRAGRATALVGRSGAGKTTIVALIYRFMEPDSGRILIDDVPLSHLDPASWRPRLGLASQDLELVDGTVEENIAYGVADAGAEAVRAAAAAADAHAFVSALPEGYATLVGHRGVNLSAGQRQRIALARALLHDPDILILDEATNALDGLSEQSVLQTLRARSGRRTTIVISHHQSTLAACDEVVLLRDGRAARGPAAEAAPVSATGVEKKSPRARAGAGSRSRPGDLGQPVT